MYYYLGKAQSFSSNNLYIFGLQKNRYLGKKVATYQKHLSPHRHRRTCLLGRPLRHPRHRRHHANGCHRYFLATRIINRGTSTKTLMKPKAIGFMWVFHIPCRKKTKIHVTVFDLQRIKSSKDKTRAESGRTVDYLTMKRRRLK